MPEQAGLNLTLSDTPKTCFLATRPILFTGISFKLQEAKLRLYKNIEPTYH